ncbi:MAG: cysteine--tRNA ligase [Bifidobacteriaceae bacterium]|nr:cysteine--tRNA ligase [Bifidobacteriaceae bacterium]
MNLRLYDTQAAEIRQFVPLIPGRASIYLCGATVQAAPHIGHLRPAVVFDILRRWLARGGLDVTLVRNVTDIDDKILTKAAGEGVEWWAHAWRYEQEFTAVYGALGIIPPTYEPRATGHILDMIELIAQIIERGHAYAGRPGNVYFDVKSWPEYGSLTHQRLSELAPAEEGEIDGDKRSPYDFALWKAPKPGEPASAAWPTPWGRGRPGWHIECSAMARRYLGDSFDIHGGGLDLRFPHHENEQAQSRAAGLGFARYWMHNGWVTESGVKMSKSLGNTLSATALLATAPAVVVRYALTQGHYRSMIEFSPSTLSEAGAAWDRLAGFVERAGQRVGQPTVDLATQALPEAFVAEMDDDLGVPGALAVVHETVRRGNSALAEFDDDAARQALLETRAMLDALGLDPLDPRWSRDQGDARANDALSVLVEADLARRAEARAQRDFAAADAIRERLAGAGITVEDSPTGARWSLG